MNWKKQGEDELNLSSVEVPSITDTRKSTGLGQSIIAATAADGRDPSSKSDRLEISERKNPCLTTFM